MHVKMLQLPPSLIKGHGVAGSEPAYYTWKTVLGAGNSFAQCKSVGFDGDTVQGSSLGAFRWCRK
jgi:hypothetical protein